MKSCEPPVTRGRESLCVSVSLSQSQSLCLSAYLWCASASTAQCFMQYLPCRQTFVHWQRVNLLSETQPGCSSSAARFRAHKQTPAEMHTKQPQAFAQYQSAPLKGQSKHRLHFLLLHPKLTATAMYLQSSACSSLRAPVPMGRDPVEGQGWRTPT